MPGRGALVSLALACMLLSSRPASVVAAEEVPPIPPPVAVELDAATTAFLVLDMTETICAPRPMCVDTVAPVASLLERARAAGVLVVYSGTGTAAAPNAAVLPPLTPRAGDPIVVSRADKFFATDLDEILAAHGIRTAVIVGVAANGAPMYTTFGANIRGYTVVVAEDGLSADDPFAVTVGRWQVLNQSGANNPENRPLAEARATLSRTDLISFR
jgi:nicotinamidase-related amidase